MTDRLHSGLFVAEGSSDLPLAGIVQDLFLERGITVRLSQPDFSVMPEKVRKDIASRLLVGTRLMRPQPELIVVHRDADNAGTDKRRQEIADGAGRCGIESRVLPVIPIRMTEAWLLLDESAIREVAGNPRGKNDLCLPKPHEVESRSNPKKILADILLLAADASGRRRKDFEKRFFSHRRQLLERLDPHGPIVQLSSWQALVADIDATAAHWQGHDGD
jgi:hypothetical protein